MGMLRTAFSVAIFAITLWWIYSGERFDPESLRGKRVIVTGSSMGIGEEIAYQYSKLGAKIVLTARSEDRLKTVAEKCRELGAQQVEIVPADMGIEESRKKVVETAKEKFGGLDILILNHVGAYESSANMAKFRKKLEVTFISYVDVANQALPLLEQSKGHLGIVSSIAGKIPIRFYSSYSACKFALEGYFGSIRREIILNNTGVSISLAFLGVIGTDKVMAFIKDKNMDENMAVSTENTALAIIEGVSTRVNDIYYPLLARILAETYKISPELAYKIFFYFYKFDEYNIA